MFLSINGFKIKITIIENFIKSRVENFSKNQQDIPIPVNLHIPKAETFEDIIAILHEFGHLVNYDLAAKDIMSKNTFEYLFGISTMKHYKSELSAWLYVFNCIKPKHHEKIINLMKTKVVINKKEKMIKEIEGILKKEVLNYGTE